VLAHECTGCRSSGTKRPGSVRPSSYVLSQASLIDRALGKRSIISTGLSIYESLTERVVSSLPLIGPFYQAHSPLHAGLVQLFVLMGGIFCSTNFYTLQSEGATVFQRLFDLSRFKGNLLYRLQYAGIRTFSLYLFGPALYVYLMYVAIAKRAPCQRVFGFTFQPKQILAYYGSLVVLVFAFLWLAGWLTG
jgi:hypothetical protein